MEDVLIGNAGRACMDSANEVKPHPNTGMPQSAPFRRSSTSFDLSSQVLPAYKKRK